MTTNDCPSGERTVLRCEMTGLEGDSIDSRGECGRGATVMQEDHEGFFLGGGG